MVILTYGASDKVTGLLDHLHAEAIDVPTELIVVHNPSRPGKTLTLPVSADVRPLQLDTNLGYVGGMNAGIDLALSSDPEFVLLLTHDVRITAGAVQGLLALMYDHGDVASSARSCAGLTMCSTPRASSGIGGPERRCGYLPRGCPARSGPARLWTGQ